MTNATASQLETTETVTETTPKRKAGRRADPNSMTARAMALLASIPVDELKKEDAIKRLVSEIGCKETSAMTYFYTHKSNLSKKS